MPSLGQPHHEGDELVYLSLCDNLIKTGNYSLQGTPILKNSFFPKKYYDKPFFHHPPLYIFLMTPLVKNFGKNSAVIVSWVGHFLVLISALILLAKFIERSRRLTISLVMLLIAIDPLMVFASQKIWFDSLLAGLTSISTTFFILGVEEENIRKRKLFLSVSGLFMGMAINTKIPAILVLPVFVFAFFLKSRFRNKKGLIMGCTYFLLPTLLLAAPWFIKFYSYYGKFLPDWLAWDESTINASAFVSFVRNRPFHYFFTQMFLISPLFLIPVYFVVRFFRETTRLTWLFCFWFLWILASMTLLAKFGGYTYQMRFVTMSCVPIYVLLGFSLERMALFSNPVLMFITLVGLIINAMTDFFHIVYYERAVIVSLFELYHQVL
jgi:4-amino-4-deoxy-L-arabinose transferase-like glycosyltransferase